MVTTSRSIEQISVLLPINTTRDGEQVIQASFKIPSNLPPLEFLRQVQRLMGVDPDKPVRIGYRVVPSNKSEPFVRFETEEDVANAMMSTLTRMKRAVSRTVQLELSNLDYKPGTAASSTSANGTKKNEPPKSQSAFQDELRICREKLHYASPSASSESSSSSNEDESDAEGESLSISEVLAALDMKQPASHYPKYQDALTAQGVVYARSALDFSVKWYVQEIKMPEGLVRPFLRQVQTMLRKRHRQSRENTDRHKRVRIGNENIDPVLLA
ncbi:hypothetical protein DICSQDRAFT_170666 [Dichomitus squalens LYAD-421 SS1]|uniref:Uncharacterized protein n=1 Tax=Dichomitus squalens (strain LYAD-421) TaxID=732165 RepID=R7SYJ6_DICSQ|nr:uncharacterized protein DICSQDRAFT_170666 [Dichomitus squalens LYAD-421 SS1]EJF60805.1 hypothetical protein DICSQDRAFT_170666 [Dichomitus squalens LYAD-421 SS1]